MSLGFPASEGALRGWCSAYSFLHLSRESELYDGGRVDRGVERSKRRQRVEVQEDGKRHQGLGRSGNIISSTRGKQKQTHQQVALAQQYGGAHPQVCLKRLLTTWPRAITTVHHQI